MDQPGLHQGQSVGPQFGRRERCTKDLHADKLRKYHINVDEISCDTISAGQISTKINHCAIITRKIKLSYCRVKKLTWRHDPIDPTVCNFCSFESTAVTFKLPHCKLSVFNIYLALSSSLFHKPNSVFLDILRMVTGPILYQRNIWT